MVLRFDQFLFLKISFIGSLFSDSFHFLKDERLKKAVSDFTKREGDLHQQYLNELESRVPFKD